MLYSLSTAKSLERETTFLRLSVRSPYVVVRSNFFLPHAATVRDGPLFGALGILELIPVKLGVEYAGQYTGRRKVVAVILPEALLLVHRALGRARIGGQRSGRHIILIPLAGGTAGHEAAQRIQRVRLARCRGVRYDCDNSCNETHYVQFE